MDFSHEILTKFDSYAIITAVICRFGKLIERLGRKALVPKQEFCTVDWLQQFFVAAFCFLESFYGLGTVTHLTKKASSDNRRVYYASRWKITN